MLDNTIVFAKLPPVRAALFLQGGIFVELKQILQEMGSTLVTDYGFRPGKLEGKHCLDQSTAPIILFLIWLESTPEAKQVLANMGYALQPARTVPQLKIAQ